MAGAVFSPTFYDNSPWLLDMTIMLYICMIPGKDCDLLIHEASMEDELVEDARHKRHRSEHLLTPLATKAKGYNYDRHYAAVSASKDT